ncbi:hypothetical protein Sjap_016726 [Stephania japonica]|uniref:Clp R domain-containing protein n=1 Tax=Stephania japonica TaxID=461633 RepID=A0AAP0ILI2_9MAGN
MEVSISSPLCVHSMDFCYRRRRRFLSSLANCSPIRKNNNRSSSSLSALFSSSSSYSYSAALIGAHPNPNAAAAAAVISRSRRRRCTISRPIVAVFERFTERAVKAVVFSQREAKSLGKSMVFTQHLLLGLVAEDRAPDGYLGSGITIDRARDAVRAIWSSDQSDEDEEARAPKSTTSSDVAFSISTKRVLEAAVDYSRNMGYNFIAPEHISIGLFMLDDGSAARVLKRLGANLNHLAAAAVSRLQGELAKDEDKTALSQFCMDLTSRAAHGLIDPVIGRHQEIQRMIQILCRRTKNNPILLGEPGVGKTAIAEGLAISIANAHVPPFLLTKCIMSLDIGLLMAGAKERGELEARVTTLITEIQTAGNIILFIDEVHTLIGSGTVGRGNKGSGLDISNLLKPSLGRGELQCIASTTMDEYRAHFELDKALARRFQPVLINEPCQEDAIRILLGLREKYEAHHKCKYTLEAINSAVLLSARYISDRHLPDKAIDLIDEAGSRARIDAFMKRKEQQTCVLSKSPFDYWQEIRAVQAMHEVVLANKMKYGGSASGAIEDTRLVSEAPISSASDDDQPVMVGPEDIAAVASLWSGIPVQQLTVDERKFLLDLETQLSKRVVGQDDAVSAISRAVKRSRVGLKDPDRPIAAMFFCGPTGVGKTELTKALAACCFGSEAAMLRLDMSEYMERHTVSKLIGSPPGYIGYGEGGTLTESVRRRPFTVILLDEIEKAHPDIFSILLQVFEDGHLTDSQGRRVSFKNTLIVMTSNVGSAAIAKGRRNSIGFMIENEDEPCSYSCMKALVMEELKAYFRPELLNRIDDVVVFHSLKTAQLVEIVHMMLREVKERVMSLGIGLEVSKAMIELVCKQGCDLSYGARPLRRAVSRLIEDVLCEALLSGDCKPGDTVGVDVDASGNPFVRKNESGQSPHISNAKSLT